jgi:hypothetical protein
LEELVVLVIWVISLIWEQMMMRYESSDAKKPGPVSLPFSLTVLQDDDEELPDLEEDKAADKPETTAEVKADEPKATATSSKIQEVS